VKEAVISKTIMRRAKKKRRKKAIVGEESVKTATLTGMIAARMMTATLTGMIARTMTNEVDAVVDP
jgi:hypothetical protein